MPRALITLPLFLLGCLSASSRDELRRLQASMDRLAEERSTPSAASIASPAPAAAAATPPAAELEGPIDLRTLIEEAIRNNPELREREARAYAAVEDVHRAGALDDPVFKAETEAVPLHQPVAFDRAQDNMLGLSQSFPFPGKLALRQETALEAAKAQREAYRGSRSELVARMKRSYYEYFMLSKELEIHIEHVRLLGELERISDVKFRTGGAPQQDVLKAQLELIMLHNDVLVIERRIASAKATINLLLHRPIGAPLGKPRDLVLTAGRQDLEALEEKAMTARPELRALELQWKSSQAALELSRKDALLPDMTVGVDYWQIPRGDDAWGGFFSFNLPWLTGKRSAEARRSRFASQADEMALERGRQQVYLEVRDAFLRVQAARESEALIRGELLPKSAQSVEVSRSSYENSRASFLELLDAERSQRNVQLSYYRALAEYESALADLERAAGTNLEDEP